MEQSMVNAVAISDDDHKGCLTIL